jgi:hypothetical protein
MKHPYHDYTTEKAIILAHNLIIFRSPDKHPSEIPEPSIEEALEIIQEVKRRTPHTWITGRIAEEVLKLTMGLITEQEL